ncbi:MAG: anaerobic ribonucleoside-triphosphate reductase activating protein [Oscillospiraceae bacterium]|jgi:anaerobic ribonucleoside-triphosphate reductase activating protein|nr:anaerobic ribonucleoside-triphosphate reductase activating protein [Oscillospiraceae bacterium]
MIENQHSTQIKFARLSNIIEDSIVDGPGLRFVVFFQGCPHKCKGCHNPETHDFSGGYEAPISQIIKDLKNNPLISGLTLSGGEPFCQPQASYQLAKFAHTIGLDVAVYTGYTIENLLNEASSRPIYRKILKEIDTLIDGPFILSQRSLLLKFRGSKNQKIIDPKLSLKYNVAVEKNFE